MLDKNPGQIVDASLTWIHKEFERHNLNIVLCSDPFHKIEFLNKLINSVRDPIIFVDMDLLYTGYSRSGMIQNKEGVLVLSPDKTNWREELSKTISKTSKRKFLVIIDSFNGIYNSIDNTESARFIHSCIMLLSSIGKQSQSSIVLTGMARKKENNEWVLSPGGRRIIQSEKVGVYLLEKDINDLIIAIL